MLSSNYIMEKELTVLAIELEHISAYRALPLAHRDPFDRLLVAQAQVEHLTIVTADERFSEYDVKDSMVIGALSQSGFIKSAETGRPLARRDG